ncbi:MAG TPA: AEC family transporter [Burkholderiaceae bacterium]|nr:AEC family transporter [Burkholderiaceae bacterium]
MLAVLEVTLPVFALVLCGHVASGRRLLPDRAVEGINAFVFHFALPAMLFRVVAQRPIAELLDWRYIFGYLAAGLAAYLLVWRSASRGRFGLPQAADRTRAAALALHATHGNIGYLGLALVAELDPMALPTVALTIICDIFVFIALSMVLMELGAMRQDDRPAVSSRSPWLPVARSLGRSPLVLSIGAGLLVSIADLPVPAAIDNFTRMLAGAAGPAALFAIGAALGAQPLRIDRQVAALVFAKLVLYPVAVAASLFLLFRPDPMVAAVGVLCAALPAASNSFIIAQRYRVPTEAIGAATAVGTVLSVLSITVTIWLLGLR